MNYNSVFYKAWHKVATFFSDISWTTIRSWFNGGKRSSLTVYDLEMLRARLATSYYIILVEKKSHLSTWLVAILTYLRTGRASGYSHILMNCDIVSDASKVDEMKFMEALNDGATFTTFNQVFDDVDSVCLLKPKAYDLIQWNLVIDGMIALEGTPYDDLFNLADASHMSCVELVLDALQKDPNYLRDFPNLEMAIKKMGNLTPQMYRDCPDFEVVVEIRR